MTLSSHPRHGEILLTEAQIQNRVAELGAQITRDYEGRPPLLIGALKGAFVFMADLARAIDLAVEVDFMALSSYGKSTQTSGVVRILKDLETDLADRDVLIVEDIVDSGLTLDYLSRNLEGRGTRSLEVCALLVREGRQQAEPALKYIGFEIPPAFVIGYGLDAGEFGRNLPYIARYLEETP